MKLFLRLKLHILLLIIFISYNIKSQDSALINIMTFDRNITVTSKLVNGIYIEFLGGFINGAGGIWAQELNDRGFDFMCGNRDTLCQWKRWSTNPNPENKHWILEDSCYNENGRYSIRITGDSNNNLWFISKYSD